MRDGISGHLGGPAGGAPAGQKVCGVVPNTVGRVARLRRAVVGHGRSGKTAPCFGVDLEIEPGTLTVLAGGPDSGADTVLLVLAGLLAIDEGEAEIAGMRFGPGFPLPGVPGRSTTWQTHVGYVPPTPSAVEYLTVAENLALPAVASDSPENESRVRRLLRTLRLESVRNRFPEELTPVQRRCLALGQALVHAPDLLVVPADPEISSSTSASGRTRRSDLVASLIDLVDLDGHTVVTSLAETAPWSTSTRIVEFDAGGIVADSSQASR